MKDEFEQVEQERQEDKFRVFKFVTDGQYHEIIAMAKQEKQPSPETAKIFLERRVIKGRPGAYEFEPGMQALALEYEKDGLKKLDLAKLLFMFTKDE